MNDAIKFLYKYCNRARCFNMSDNSINRGFDIFEKYRTARGRFLCLHEWSVLEKDFFAPLNGYSVRALCKKCGKIKII